MLTKKSIRSAGMHTQNGEEKKRTNGRNKDEQNNQMKLKQTKPNRKKNEMFILQFKCLNLSLAALARLSSFILYQNSSNSFFFSLLCPALRLIRGVFLFQFFAFGGGEERRKINVPTYCCPSLSVYVYFYGALSYCTRNFQFPT